MEPSSSVQKSMRARKTMTPSSREQVARLQRLSSTREPGRTASAESPLVDPSPEEQNALRPPPPPLVKPVSDLAAGSGVRSGTQDAAQEPPGVNAEMEQFLSAGSLRDLLYHLYESEPDFSQPKPVEVRLDMVLTGCSLDRPEGLQFPPASAANHNQQQDQEEALLGGLKPVVSEQESSVSRRRKGALGSSVPLEGSPRKRRKLGSAEGGPHEASDRASDGSTGSGQQNNLEHLASGPPRAGRVYRSRLSFRVVWTRP